MKTPEQEAATVNVDDRYPLNGKDAAYKPLGYVREGYIVGFQDGIEWRDANPKKSILIMESGYIDDSGKRHVTDRIIKEE